MCAAVSKGCHKHFANCTNFSHEWKMPNTHKSLPPFFSVRRRRLPSGTCRHCCTRHRLESSCGSWSRSRLDTFSYSGTNCGVALPCACLSTRGGFRSALWTLTPIPMQTESKKRTSCSHIPLGYWASMAVANPPCGE